jgi:hypothetical protein
LVGLQLGLVKVGRKVVVVNIDDRHGGQYEDGDEKGRVIQTMPG